MKILYIHHGNVIGGSQVSLLNTILGLKQIDDIDFKVLCFNEKMKSFFKEKADVETGDIFNPCLILGRALIGWNNIFDKQTFKMILEEIKLFPTSIKIQTEQLRKEKPDIIHLNSSILFTTALAAKRLNIPIVWHVREVLYGSSYNIRKIFAGWLIRKFADKVIAISPSEAKSLGKDETQKVDVVFNFVDFTKFDYQKYNNLKEKEKLKIKPDEKLIISLGGLSWRKGTLELLKAMKYTGKNIKLIIAGDYLTKNTISKKRLLNVCIENILVKLRVKKTYTKEYLYRVEKAFEALPSGKAHFIGPLTDVIPLIAACDLLASPHTFPHFSRPIFEAGAMKKPVIAFDIEGISENIDHDIDGILVKKISEKALAEGINNYISQSDKLREMGEKGFEKAYKLFRRDLNVIKIFTTYQNLLGADKK